MKGFISSRLFLRKIDSVRNGSEELQHFRKSKSRRIKTPQRCRDRGRVRSRDPYRDFVLSGEVGPFAQQLALRQGEDAGSFSNQHRVVEATVARSCWDQVTTLDTDNRERRVLRRGIRHIDALFTFNQTFLGHDVIAGKLLHLSCNYKVGMLPSNTFSCKWV